MSKVDNEEMATDIDNKDNKKAGLSIALGLISYVFLVLAVYLAYRLMSISLIFGPIGVCSAILAFTLCKKGYQHNTKKRIWINIGKGLAGVGILFGVLASFFVYGLYSEECCGVGRDFGAYRCALNNHDLLIADSISNALEQVLTDPSFAEYNDLDFSDNDIKLEDFIEQLSPELQEAFFNIIDYKDVSDIYNHLKGKGDKGWYSETGMYVRFKNGYILVFIPDYEESYL